MRISRSRRYGFSIIELMFSMAIGSIILILAATLLGSSSESYSQVSGSLATEREARALLTQLSEDLSTAIFHKDSVIQKSASIWPNDRLGFLSLKPTAVQTAAHRIGDLCAVNYYVKDQRIGGKNVRCLMRGFRESNDTFKALKTQTLDPLFIDQPTIDEPLAFGVVSFEARPKSRDNTGKWIDWINNGMIGPEALVIKLVLARRKLSAKLETPADWDGTSVTGNLLGNSSEADRNKNFEVYGTTLHFGHHPSL